LECCRLCFDRSGFTHVSGQSGQGKKGDISRFIEDAVQAHILELTAEQAKTANVHLDEAELTLMVDEALD
jgi:hypothetical protein